MRREWMLALAAVSGLAASSFGQQQNTDPAPRAAQPPVLEGPKTGTADKPLTLVERDFEGKLKRLDIPPEEAAVQIMDLEPAERERVNKIFAERAAVVDEAVLKNLDLLAKLHSAVQAGDQEQIRAVSARFLSKLERLRDHGKLDDEIKPQLRMDHVPEFQRLISEYRQALLQEGMREAKAAGKDVPAQTIANRETMLVAGQQIRRSYDRTVGAKVAEFESLISKLALRPDQETKIRNLATQFAQDHMGKATPEQKRDLIIAMLKEMDLDQRIAFAKLLNGGE